MWFLQMLTAAAIVASATPLVGYLWGVASAYGRCRGEAAYLVAQIRRTEEHG